MSKSDIAAVREFNRFHTRLVGALNERLLASDYSLPHLRVLYEVANSPPGSPVAASELAHKLRMDPGYLSRVMKRLQKDGLVARTPSPRNAKRLGLTLTAKGKDVFADIDAASAVQVEQLLSPLDDTERDELIGAMARIRRLLGDTASDRSVVLRDPLPGDLGWIIHRQARLYAKEYGWDQSFEGLVAEIVGQFVKNFVPGREKCWVAESDGGIIGSVFVVRQDDDTAKLRLLYVEQSARGLGVGRRLVDECIRFANAAGYARLELWTNDILASARRIYRAAGFRLVDSQPHHSFGKDLVGQTWCLDL